MKQSEIKKMQADYNELKIYLIAHWKGLKQMRNTLQSLIRELDEGLERHKEEIKAKFDIDLG